MDTHRSAPILLTKFDVAERQLHQSIRLFFADGDPVSVHTLAEAAAQVLYDMRGVTGARSIVRDTDIVYDEYKKEWINTVLMSRNFFKHADRDVHDVHEFKIEFNHFSIFDAVNMYNTAKAEWTPETLLYIVWFTLNYPRLVRKDTDFARAVEKVKSGPDAPPSDRLSFYAQAIEKLRAGELSLPGVTLALGIAK